MPDPAIELTQIAEHLRARSNNGLHYTDDPYQVERFHKILGLSARLLAMADQRELGEIERTFFDDLDLKTPIETLDVRWFSLHAIPWTELSAGHEARIRHALAWHANKATPPFFDREGWHPQV